MSTITFKVEFGGGLELLFGNKRVHSISLPSLVPSDNNLPSSLATLTKSDDGVPSSYQETLADGLNPSQGEGKTKQLDIQYLMFHLRARVLRERPELFMDGDNLRPGVLVLINDTDWELEGEEGYQIHEGDEIVFISTLHGG